MGLSGGGDAKHVVVWVWELDLPVVGGTGLKYAGLYLTVGQRDERLRPFFLYSSTSDPRATLHVWLDEMGEAFGAGAQPRRELCDRIDAVVPVDMSPEAHYPGIPFNRLGDQQAVEAVLRDLSWALEVIRRVLVSRGPWGSFRLSVRPIGRQASAVAWHPASFQAET